jgi:Zn-dependent protease with chaperone function
MSTRLHAGGITRGWWPMVGLLAASMFAAEAARAECIDIEDPRPIVQQVQNQRDVARQAPKPPADGEGETVPEARPTGSMLALTVGQDQVLAMRRVARRLAAEAHLMPVVGICESEVVNAFATNRARGISSAGLVIVTSAMMEFLGTDENRIAALLSHEFAHLLEDHGAAKATFDRRAARRAIEVGTEMESERRGIGTLAARQYFELARQAYSREVERRADDVGYQLYHAAGFDPREAARLFQSLRERFGGAQEGYFASHPGWDERIGRLLALARDDAARAEVAARAQAVAAESENYAAVAEEHWRAGRWRDLSELVGRWIGALPDSGLGWYYRGLLMKGSVSGRAKAWEAFAKAVELDPARPQLWEALVEALVDSGYRQEAVAAVAAMSSLGYPTRSLRERFFDDGVWVHGGARGSPSNLWWAKDETGQRVIANDRGSFAIRGLQEERVPPEWVPAR